MNRLLRLCAPAWALASLFVLAPASAQDAIGRRALEHEDYEKWNSLGSPSMTEDGRWVSFTVRPPEGGWTMTIREVATQKQYTVANGSRLRFTHDGAHAVYLVEPDPELVKKLREDDGRKGDLPKPKLEILELESGRHATLPDVDSFSMPEEASGWLAYLPSRTKDQGAAKAGESELVETYSIAPEGLSRKAPAEAEEENAEKQEKEKREKDNGRVLVLRDMATGIERRIPDVSSHRFGKAGARLVYAASATDAEDDGVFVVDLATGEIAQVAGGRGAYRSLAISDDEQRVAFLTDRDDYGPVKASMSLHVWSAGDEAAEMVADASTEAFPEGWWIAPTSLSFTEDGRRLLFQTQPKPDDAGKTKKQLEKERKAKARDPQAVVDIWHWKDDALQPQQLLQAERERNRAYRALVDLEAGRVVQLATEDVPDVFVDPRSTADVAIGTSSKKYAVSRSWESPGFSDTYLVDLTTGEATLVLEKVRGSGSLSPDGVHVTWWDPDQRKQYAMSVAGREIVDLSADIPTSLANELHDTPSPPRSYRSAGWLEGDAAVLLYDRFDIWQVDPTGAEAPRCITGGKGRETTTRYRYVRLDREQRHVPTDAPMLLSAFDETSKASGYAMLDAATGEITTKVMLDERVGGLAKAEKGDTVLMTRQTFRRYPDLWATTMDFESLSRLSFANPQQREYLWGTSELVQYQTEDGVPLQGILYKPDDFDPARQYPMMVYFYERNSDNLHRYVTPSAGRASINYAFYVSRGYVIFVPDIPYTTGHPGKSAANAVLPGIRTVLDMGFVDPERVGVQGHSWGGYQIAYLVTMTDMFACAEAGAPVTNMTSAYGGIRWASGLSRMFQYEKTQSRIGGTLWEARDLYLENSPVFFADKVNTPLLMLHNDEDGAVPWYQGIEMFVALRRLGKPAWLLNYNGEAHGLRKKENREDFTRRMQQFFDHYLMGGPATMWIAEGVPATVKGEEFGFGPIEAEPEPESGPESEVEPEVEAGPEAAVATAGG